MRISYHGLATEGVRKTHPLGQGDRECLRHYFELKLFTGSTLLSWKVVLKQPLSVCIGIASGVETLHISM